MYQIILDNKTIGYIKEPVYTKYNEDVFVIVPEDEATFIYYDGSHYNILGKGNDESFQTVMLVPIDEGDIAFYQSNMIDGLIISAVS